MSCDRDGCLSLQDLFERMSQAKWPGRQIIRPDTPPRLLTTVLQVPSGVRKVEKAERMTLKHACTVPGSWWNITTDGSSVTLEVGTDKLKELQKSVNVLADGEDDFCIGPDQKGAGDEQFLWFWNLPSQKKSRP